MINKISFLNYKAFTEGEVKIRPITILLGANSVGKSSIMQLFLMLQQTALSEGNYKSALKLHGGFVSLGEGVNLIRKKDNSKTLSISLDFYNGRIYDELKEVYFNNFCLEVYSFSTLVRDLYRQQTKQKDNLFKKAKKLFTGDDDRFDLVMRIPSKKTEDTFDRDTFIELINDTHTLVSKINLKEFPKGIKEDIAFFTHFPGRHSRLWGGLSQGNTDHFKLFRERKDEYLLTYDFLKGIKDEINKGHFKINYEIAIVEKNLVLKKFTILNEENEIISIEFDLNPSNNFKAQSITSKYIERDKLKSNTLQSVREILSNQKTIFSFVSDIKNKKKETNDTSVFADTLRTFLSSVNNIASDYFENDNINYVSPLRAHPKRYYFLDKAKINAYVDTLDGDAIAETLKENSYLRDQVNAWLQKFNLKVEVSQLQDIIHKLVVNQNSLSLDITDVGFGISQVLPVIIQGFLSHDNSLTLIEQPEIHLHPKMQADLADLFIDIVLPSAQKKKDQKASKYLFIETHSEYLLKRLRRRISDGTISADNVAIYLIDPQTDEQGAIIKELKVKEKGQFDWPVDFYGGELLKDTTEFIKNQQKTNI
jgi:predicted ATPase